MALLSDNPELADKQIEHLHLRPLHRAAEAGATRSAELLLEHHADVNAADGADRSPLHVAAQHSQAAMVVLLLERGAAMNAQDNQARTALQVAVAQGHIECVNRLLAKRSQLEDEHYLMALNQAVTSTDRQRTNLDSAHGSRNAARGQVW